MERTKRAVSAALLLALSLARLLFPAGAAAARERVGRVLGRGEGTQAAVLRLSDRLAAFAAGGRSVAALSPAAVPTATPRDLRYTARHTEEALSEGEDEPPEPEAVAAFLARQAPFADLALPEDADFAWEPFPADCAQPVAGRGSSGFGWRVHPILGGVRFHYGTDVAAAAGETVRAFAAGTVTEAGWDDGYGRYLRIAHADGWESLYAHCSALLCAAGDTVEAGDAVARVGATGLATGPHLHFELAKDGVRRNPEYYLAAWEG